mgnify:CR=1 FL=1
MIKIKNIALFLSVSLLVVSCRPEEDEVLDFSEIVQESENYKEGNEVVSDSASIDSTTIPKLMFLNGGIEASELSFFEDRLFPDRFGPESTEKYKLTLGTDTVWYYKWRYKDSIKVMNALYNWIDCFGENCKSIYLKESKNMQRMPMKIMVSDTTLIYIQAKESVDFKMWDAFHDSLGYKKDWNLIIEQRKSSRARWYVYENEEKILYKE